MRIPINYSGSPSATLPKYAMSLEGDTTPLSSIVRAIVAKTGHDVVTCRLACVAGETCHYEMQLGKRIESGGWHGTGQITLYI